MSFNENTLEQVILALLAKQGYPTILGADVVRAPEEVLIEADLHTFLTARYGADGITDSETSGIIRKLQAFSALDLYESNKAILKMVSDGFLLQREDRQLKDLYIQLVDYGSQEARRDAESTGNYNDQEARRNVGMTGNYNNQNIYKCVTQLRILGSETRIPDAILYINGLPLVVFEFKSTVREEATIHDAFVQITTRYRRDIPQLFKYNALCILSDGVNSKLGSFFAPYEYFYAWRKITGNESVEQQGIDSLHTMIEGLFDPARLRDVIRNFVYFPDSSRQEVKIVCRYPQYYATRKLYDNIRAHLKPEGDGKGGTYFGATGCGKSFTMLFLTRLLMRSVDMASPTIVLITDRTDLDSQLSQTFTAAKGYVGDEMIVSVESRSDLRDYLKGRESGGVFLTTIHKFNEDIALLSERTNIICISDEAHRSQTNLDEKVVVHEDGVKRSYGFAKYLHESLPNATYVGFTGTPIDATLDVFGAVVDAYTMSESVHDEITVRIVYEGRAAKVMLDHNKLKEIEDYYDQCAQDGANEHQIEESKKASANMNAILGDPDRLKAIAADFVQHYEMRVAEGSSVRGKAMFVCSSRLNAWRFYQEVIALRPDWAEVLPCAEGLELSEQEKRDIMPMARLKMIMTRGKDDEVALYEMLGTKDYRKELDRQFKTEQSNFKIAIVVDMWLTGFDVPFLDTIYIDKPIQKHNLIQTISRVNRQYEGKVKGLVVDYIGIKNQMNLALAQYSKGDEQNIEDIGRSVEMTKNYLDLLRQMLHLFETKPYFEGNPQQQLSCLKLAAEFVMVSEAHEKRFMDLVKHLKAAYDVCVGSEQLSQSERDHIHFYMAVRSIIFKLNKGNAPDTAQMNARVRDMIRDALQSDGVEEIFRLGSEGETQIDIFDPAYLEKLDRIKLPNTKLKLLQQMLSRAIGEVKKVNKMQGVDFSKKFNALVENYNERKEEDVLKSETILDISDDLTEEIYQRMKDLMAEMAEEVTSFEGMGIDVEEKAFYDILTSLAHKYDFEFAEDKTLDLAKAIKEMVDNKATYTDWHKREDIKASMKVDLILLMGKHGYPPVTKDELYKEIFEQAENFKKNRMV